MLGGTLAAGWLTIAVFDGICVLIQARGLAQRLVVACRPTKLRTSGMQGVGLVAITYVYFLIFAQFAFSTGSTRLA